jgi:hypothetical protein
LLHCVSRKQFFFEKKNQKTFNYISNRQKCFVSSFQKRNTSFLASAGGLAAYGAGEKNALFCKLGH